MPASTSKKRKTPMWTEQVTPSRRRLLINGSLELGILKENSRQAAPVGWKAQADVEEKQAQMKRRRTIKQDESLEGSPFQEAQLDGSTDNGTEQDGVRATEVGADVAGEEVQSESESEPDTVE